MSRERLAEFWDARAATYDDKGPGDVGTAWRHTATNVLLTRCEAEPDDVILDLGTGTGNVARTLAPHVKRVIGVDISPAMLERAQDDAPANLELRCGDLREPPHVLGLTHVTACCALTGLSDRERRALWDRVYAMLPVGGLLVVADHFWTIPPEQVEADFFDPSWMRSVSAQGVMEELERDERFVVVMEPLHPLVTVLTARRR